jgi:hypothetical protein
VRMDNWHKLPPPRPLFYVPNAPEHRQSRKKKIGVGMKIREKKNVPFVHKPVGVRVRIDEKTQRKLFVATRVSDVDLGLLVCGVDRAASERAFTTSRSITTDA